MIAKIDFQPHKFVRICNIFDGKDGADTNVDFLQIFKGNGRLNRGWSHFSLWQYDTQLETDQDSEGFGSLQTAARLPPPVFIDDIGERDTADGSKPAHRVTDWQQSIRVEVGRKTHSGLRFLLELQV